MKHLFVIINLAAAIIPLLEPNDSMVPQTGRFPGWPKIIQGRKLTEIGLSEREKKFSQGFPGRIARFSSGRDEIIIRWLKTPTRKLHPSSDCLKGMGFKIRDPIIQVDPGGRQWGCQKAERKGKVYRVCERIFDRDGKNWTDVSAWYWAALLRKSRAPWWAVTIAEPIS